MSLPLKAERDMENHNEGLYMNDNDWFEKYKGLFSLAGLIVIILMGIVIAFLI